MSRGVFGVVLCALFVAAVAMRVPDLGNRPMHTDEAIHTVKLASLWQTGRYVYDPDEYHGPTLYYTTLPILWLSHTPNFASSAEWMYRLAPALFGALTVLLVALLADGLSYPGALAAAALVAFSPACVFYSRYYIQETLLAFFTLLLLGCGWRWRQSRHPGWAAVGGAALGVMTATKETWILAAASMVGGVLAAALLGSRRRKAAATPAAGTPIVTHPATGRRSGAVWLFAALAFVVAAAVLFYLCFAVFSRDPRGPANAFRAFTHYTHRANKSDHVWPWSYYLVMLLDSRILYATSNRAALHTLILALQHGSRRAGPGWSEALIVGGAVCGMLTAAFAPARRHQSAGPAAVPGGVGRAAAGGPAAGADISLPLLRFLAVYVLLLTAVYSVIPYKTPWCVLSPLQGMALLAGAGFVVLVRSLQPRALRLLLVVLLLAGFVELAWQSYRASFPFSTSRQNPYVYSPTSADLLGLVDLVHGLAAVAPEGKQLVVFVAAADSDYWPLPWYLRDLPRVGYWDSAPPPGMNPPVLITSPDIAAQNQVSASAEVEYFGLRPGVVLQVAVDKALWRRYLQAPQRRKAP